MFCAVTLVCGLSPREVIEYITNLLQAIFVHSQWKDVEASACAALSCSQFKLGDEAKSVVLEVFEKCTVSGYTPANFGNMLADMWDMHQTDDVGAIAGGQAVLEFVQKYSIPKPGV